MRYTVFEVELNDEILQHNCEDVTEAFSEEDLKPENRSGLKWNIENGFQWAKVVIFQGDEVFVLVFYENHPFFNCTKLIHEKKFGTRSYTPIKVVINWFYDNVLNKV